MAIEWNKVQTNAVSAVIVSIVVGACAIVWNGIVTMDDRIETNTSDVRGTVTQLTAGQEVLGGKVDGMEKVLAEAIAKLNKCKHIEENFKPYVPSKTTTIDEIRKRRDFMQQQMPRSRKK